MHLNRPPKNWLIEQLNIISEIFRDYLSKIFRGNQFHTVDSHFHSISPHNFYIIEVFSCFGAQFSHFLLISLESSKCALEAG